MLILPCPLPGVVLAALQALGRNVWHPQPRCPNARAAVCPSLHLWAVNPEHAAIQGLRLSFTAGGYRRAWEGRPAAVQACANLSFLKRIRSGLHRCRAEADETDKGVGSAAPAQPSQCCVGKHPVLPGWKMKNKLGHGVLEVRGWL